MAESKYVIDKVNPDSKQSDSVSSLNERIEVFYIPGVYGDEPTQEILRNYLNGIKFYITRLPELDLPDKVLCDVVETAKVLADDISVVQQEGEIHIVGFSFGASLAVEVAIQLMNAGRIVAYLGLIDCPLYINENRRTLRRLIKIIFAPKFCFKLYRFTKNLILNKYKTIKRIPIVYTASDYRFLSLRGWNPKTCNARGILILSTHFFRSSGVKWQSICPNCKQVEILSDHNNILIGNNLYSVASVLAKDIADTLITPD